MKVVAISGVSGSGKTSVVKQLSAAFSCPYLLFDDHTDEGTYPKDMKLWSEKGADVSEIQTPRFMTALVSLLKTSKSQYIFIEEPFGRQRDSMSSLIDYVVLLDQPMEVCLSRVIMRNIRHPSSDSLTSIPNYLAMYDDHFREIYIAVTKQIRENCDLALQDVASIEFITNYISNWLKNNTNQ